MTIARPLVVAIRCAALSAGLLLAAAGSEAGEGNVPGFMGFTPIPGSSTAESATWSKPFVVPPGYRQYKVLDETDFNVYGGASPDPNDLPDMNTQNETGLNAGRYLYHSHEVDDCGAVTVIDLWTGAAKVIAQAQWSSRARCVSGPGWSPRRASLVTGGASPSLPAARTSSAAIASATAGGLSTPSTPPLSREATFAWDRDSPPDQLDRRALNS